MFSRFWYFVLAAFAAAAMAAAFLVQASTQRDATHALDESLRRDRFEVELWMSLDDHARIDAIGPMTTNTEVRAVLGEANARAAGAALAAGSRQRLESTLLQLNRQLAEGAAEVLVAIDRNGVIVGQVGGGAPATDATLRSVDFIASALGGEEKSSIWMRDGIPFRAAARPVYVGGNVIGVIVHAMDIDDDLSRRLVGHVAGTSVGFFLGDRMVASASAEGAGAAADRAAMQSALASAKANPDLRRTGRTPLLAIGSSAKGIFALFPGQPADGTLGFVVARPSSTTVSPLATLANAPSDDVAALPWPMIAGVPVLLALMGILILVFERDRPLAAFIAEVRKIADGSATKVTSSSLSGRYRIVAEDINAGIERVGATADATVRKSQSLDAMLGDAPPSTAPSFFATPSQTAPAARPATTPKAAPVARPPVAQAQAPTPAAAPPAAPPAAPAMPNTTPPPAPAPASLPPTSGGSQTFSLPPDGSDDDDDGATTVAQIPAELLSALHQDNSEEDAHFHEVFDEYVRIREQCGEATKGLTYERFVVTLQKTKTQIVSKHGASRVRFTVYIKEGKAALKASPR